MNKSGFIQMLDVQVVWGCGFMVTGDDRIRVFDFWK